MVNAGAVAGPAQKYRLEPSKNVLEYVERLPKMRPDFYRGTLKRFDGNHERWTKWAAQYMQFLWNQLKDMIERAGKQ